MDRRGHHIMLQPGESNPSLTGADAFSNSTSTNKKKPRRGEDAGGQKRRCVSTACIACRRRKSKCDGAVPSCAACASVYGTECVYDPNSDHRRKGVYREKIDSMKARNSTLQILIEAILNASEDEVPAIVKKIRTCESLDTVAESILRHGYGNDDDEEESIVADEYTTDIPIEGEQELARKMGELRLENGMVRFIGGTSHLIYLGDPTDPGPEPDMSLVNAGEDPATSWTDVTKDTQLIVHLMNMYFNWHYPYFTTLSKHLFYRDFLKGRHAGSFYCSPLLVNAMLALGCHFTALAGAYAVPGESRTKGDHFFAEAKRIILVDDEYEKPRLTTVQALALMSVREAGCGREAKGWVYSGMSFRMAQDIGLNLDTGSVVQEREKMDEHAVDARRITFWGCFLFDKCWSNYLGRLPQIPKNSYNVPKYDVFPEEDAELWSPYTDSGFDESFKQPARTRAAGLQLSKLCEISSDLLLFFYHPNHINRSSGKASDLKNLSELHRRLEDWRRELPREFEPKEGQLPNVILVHMFFHLQYIHLFRPFLKYTPTASPLPAHVSPRRICTANAGAISKLMRLYKKTWNLRQICNIAVYMEHQACTIHLLNLPEKTAKRDIIHGVKHLEEIAEDWLCARRSLGIISVLSRKWSCELPEEASMVLQRTDEKYGTFSTTDVPSPPKSTAGISAASTPPEFPHSSPLVSGEQYSPIPAFAQSHPARDPTAPERLLANASLAMMNGNQMRGNAMPVSMSMGSEPLAPTAWGAPGTTQPLPNYQTPAYATANHSNLGSAPTSRTGTRQGPSSSAFHDSIIDGQNWYLNDGVRWHQNFESWDMNSVGPQSNGSSNRVPSVPLSSDPMQFTFRSGGSQMRSARDDPVPGFDALATLNGPGWLPGLD